MINGFTEKTGASIFRIETVKEQIDRTILR
jgi:hypothetical protein